MIVVLKHGVEAAKREQLIDWLKGQGLTIHISEGEYQTVLGLVGADGIGAPLIFAMNQYAWNDVSAIFLGFVLLVWLIDAGSARLRTRRAAAAPGNKT